MAEAFTGKPESDKQKACKHEHVFFIKMLNQVGESVTWRHCRDCDLYWYENHCWKCQAYLDSRNDKVHRCKEHLWFVCPYCGACRKGVPPHEHLIEDDSEADLLNEIAIHSAFSEAEIFYANQQAALASMGYSSLDDVSDPANTPGLGLELGFDPFTGVGCQDYDPPD